MKIVRCSRMSYEECSALGYKESSPHHDHCGTMKDLVDVQDHARLGKYMDYEMELVNVCVRK